MPELPEVETIGRALKSELVGRCFTSVETFTPKLREPLDSLHQPELLNRPVQSVRRRGRYLLIDLEPGLAILMHFGMSGVLRLADADAPRQKHEHIIFHLSGDGAATLRFECPRRFSLVKLVKFAAKAPYPEELSDLGVEPLGDEFNAEMLMLAAARRRKSPLKGLIMNNSVVVGVGNIYATEALFATRLSPLRPCEALTLAEAEALVAAIKSVLRDSIATGGTTFSDYRQLDGSTGKYVLKLHAYGKRGQKCPRCGAEFAVANIGGRTSVYCPQCQK